MLEEASVRKSLTNIDFKTENTVVVIILLNLILYSRLNPVGARNCKSAYSTVYKHPHRKAYTHSNSSIHPLSSPYLQSISIVPKKTPHQTP